jgi:hypothetical protein
LAAAAAVGLHSPEQSWESLLYWVGWPDQPWVQWIWIVAVAVILWVLWDWPFQSLLELADDPAEGQDPAEASDDSTKSEGGDLRSFWRVLVAILTGLIPVLTLLGPRDDESHPLRPFVITLVLVVVALAAIQFYGQNRENLEKLESRNRINQQGDRINQQGDRINQQSALIAALVNEIRKDRTREEEKGRALDHYPDDSGVAKTESKLAEPAGSVIAGSSQFGSELAVSPKRDERTIAILKNDQRPNYDQNDEHLLDYFRDDYHKWFDNYITQIPNPTSIVIGGFLATRWPLFTGLIGVGYIFGVNWTKSHESLSIPEEDVCSLIDSWMLRLNEDLSSMRDDEIYPCLVHAINSSIRYGLQKSINDLNDGPQSLSD